MPLTTYQEVRPWAVDIKEQVLSRAMPRWGAVKGFGDLQPDNALTQEEIVIIAAWVIGGAPNGDPALLPRAHAPKPDESIPSYPHQTVVETPSVLKADLNLAALRPIGDGVIPSGRVTAVLPDGRVEPLVWLYEYDPKWGVTFRFRSPLLLPAMTRIESTSTLRLALDEATGSPPAR